MTRTLPKQDPFFELPPWYTDPRKSFHRITEMGKTRLPCMTPSQGGQYGNH